MIGDFEDCLRSSSHGFGLMLATVAFLSLAGCGGAPALPRSAVSGTVTLDGEPLTNGKILFVPIGETTGSKTSISIEDGSFAADKQRGPIVGTHRVEIHSTDAGGLTIDDENALARLTSEGKRRIHVVQVPAWYNRNSRIEATVMPGETNNFAFDLKTKRTR